MVAITGLLTVLSAIIAQATVLVDARPSNPDLVPRAPAATSVSAPAGFNLAWTVKGERPTTATASRLSLTVLAAKASNITQANVNTCTTMCLAQTSCEFATLIMSTNAPRGQVQCALYPSVVKQTDVKYKTAPGGGTVVASYGFAKDDAAVSALQRAAAKTTSKAKTTSTRRATTTAKARTTSTRRATTTAKARTTSTRRTSTTARAKSTSTRRTSTTAKARSTSTMRVTSTSRPHSIVRTTSTSTRRTSTSTRATSTTRPTTTSSVRTSTRTTTTARPTTATTTIRTLTTTSYTQTLANKTTTVRVTSSITTTSTSTGYATSKITQTTVGNSTSTSTLSTASATPTLAAPSGATLIQLKPCGSVGSIPAFANSAYNGSSARYAYISHHGSDSALDDAFEWVTSVIGTKAFPVVAPGLYLNSMAEYPRSWYNKSTNIAWGPSASYWSTGMDAVSPAGVSSCSSYDVIDYLLEYYSSNTAKFPNLEKVFVSGFSGGANMVSRYSTLADDSAYRFKVRYIVISPASQAYFSSPRPWLQTCSSAFQYPYQWVARNMPRYPASKFSGTDATSLFKRWMAKDVVNSVGTADVDEGGNQDCGTVSSGGPTRSGRSYGYWAYKNLAAQTSTDVSNYPGYGNLTQTGASSPIAAGTAFNHLNCLVSGVQHDGGRMYASSCVSAALANQQEPSGVEPPSPSQPSPTSAMPGTTVTAG